MGTVIWFTGLSGSGKTTLAESLKKELEAMGKTVDTLDGDVVRNTLNKHLGFSREDIRENNRLIAELVRERINQFDFILVPIIAPYRGDRAMAKSIIGENFIELFINSSLKECIKRDVKGLYKKAFKGEIDNFIGVSKLNPYEPPLNPDFELDTESSSVDESLTKMIDFLRSKNLF